MILQTLKYIKQHKPALKKIALSEKHSVNSVLSIDPATLKSEGIQALALDFDGVLNYHDAIDIPSDVLSWLSTCCDTLGEDHLYLHSNNNRPDRIAFLKQHFPAMHILDPQHKKPSPEGLHSITETTGIAPHQIALVDDRLLTGMLAACQAGCTGIHITQPFTNFHKSPLKEIAFVSLRWLEKQYLV